MSDRDLLEKHRDEVLDILARKYDGQEFKAGKHGVELLTDRLRHERD